MCENNIAYVQWKLVHTGVKSDSIFVELDFDASVGGTLRNAQVGRNVRSAASVA